MKKLSIVTKLFLISTLFFSIFLSIFMLGQTLFFKEFYLNMKISGLEKNMEKFSLSYAKESWDSKSITQNVNKFADQNNSQIAILDKTGFMKYAPAYDFVVETPEQQIIRIPLNGIAYLNDFQDLKLSEGVEVEVEGFFSEDLSRSSVLRSIKNSDKKWENLYAAQMDVVTLPAASAVVIEARELPSVSIGTVAVPSLTTTGSLVPSIAISPFKLTKIKGRITELNIPSRIEQVSNYNSELLWSSVNYWIWQVKTNKLEILPNDITQFHYQGMTNNTDNIVLVKPILRDNEIYEYLYVISSLQPVGEAVGAMRTYYIYAFIVAIALVLALSMVFSKTISRPLIKMNRVAAKMADFDFSEECAVQSGDELGNLASNLNQLSRNLGTNLSELKAANEQLQLDIEKERNLEKMRKEFVSSVSHEFKTPLGVIKGFAEGIKESVAEEKKDYYMGVIMDEIDKMDELVQDLLDLARLESKVQVLNLESFNVIDLIDEVENRLTKDMGEKEISLCFKYVERDLEVRADRRRIEQVVTNILCNAIRHTEYKGHIEIGVIQEENQVLLYIENSGQHIEEEDIPKIWERFYRAEKSRDRKTGGTGLGLAIVKNILELHESSFGVRNTDRGVKFYFTLKSN